MTDSQALAQRLRERGLPFRHAHEDATHEGGFRPCELVECLDAGIDGLFVTVNPAHVNVGAPPSEDSPEMESWVRAKAHERSAAHPTRLIPLTERKIRARLRVLTPSASRAPEVEARPSKLRKA